MRSNDRASHGPRARRLGTSIPAAGCRNGCEATAGQANREANTVGPRATPRSQRLCGLWLGSPQPGGLKPFVDFCRVARSGETAAGIDSLAPARLALTGLPAANLPKQPPQLRVAQHSRLQKSANALQRPSWDLISGSLGGEELVGDASCGFGRCGRLGAAGAGGDRGGVRIRHVDSAE